MEAMKKRAVADLEECRVCYFTLMISSHSHFAQLEIPQKFRKRTGWPRNSDCSLITSITTLAQWPLRMEPSGSSGGRLAWQSVGDGYRNFLNDNNVTPPALLVFEVVDDAALSVTIHLGDASPPGRALPPPKYEEDRGHFLKTLRACHTRPASSTRLDIPTAYWRAVGDTRFDGHWYNLAGPLETVKVKSARYTSSKQTFCHFTKGWVDFVALNHLKMGDTLVFAEVSEAQFEVRKL
ncbi:hypothetical protein M758_3G094000 [Ceratodon purpureus]|nr:hypothetical protein M758_3G094000 [Ceratodon purpureus]KAG0622391.1 hypothetical protein M758_3G094000 [Ceratodon purpureus]